MSSQGTKLFKMIVELVSSNTKKPRLRTNVKSRWRCVKCDKTYGLDRHHITYKPAKIALLCRNCHVKITSVNMIASIILKRKLTNEDRIRLWKWFLGFKESITEVDVIKALGIDYTFTVADYAEYISMREKWKM